MHLKQLCPDYYIIFSQGIVRQSEVWKKEQKIMALQNYFTLFLSVEVR
jgi:hypothetical protein